MACKSDIVDILWSDYRPGSYENVCLPPIDGCRAARRREETAQHRPVKGTLIPDSHSHKDPILSSRVVRYCTPPNHTLIAANVAYILVIE